MLKHMSMEKEKMPLYGKVGFAIAVILKCLILLASLYLIADALIDRLQTSGSKLFLAVGILMFIYTALGLWQILKSRRQ